MNVKTEFSTIPDCTREHRATKRLGIHTLGVFVRTNPITMNGETSHVALNTD